MTTDQPRALPTTRQRGFPTHRSDLQPEGRDAGDGGVVQPRLASQGPFFLACLRAGGSSVTTKCFSNTLRVSGCTVCGWAARR